MVQSRLTAIGTFVRVSGLALHALPPSARSRERHRGVVAAAELQFVGLTEALELTLLLADGEVAKYERAALRWHLRFAYESKNVDIRESQAVLVLLAAIPANRLAASALAELLSRRQGLERTCEVLVAWARGA
jgi:hypothetical protein